jgi:hypothetical protein
MTFLFKLTADMVLLSPFIRQSAGFDVDIQAAFRYFQR